LGIVRFRKEEDLILLAFLPGTFLQGGSDGTCDSAVETAPRLSAGCFRWVERHMVLTMKDSRDVQLNRTGGIEGEMREAVTEHSAWLTDVPSMLEVLTVCEPRRNDYDVIRIHEPLVDKQLLHFPKEESVSLRRGLRIVQRIVDRIV
jgi:hypothetical protein